MASAARALGAAIRPASATATPAGQPCERAHTSALAAPSPAGPQRGDLLGRQRQRLLVEPHGEGGVERGGQRAARDEHPQARLDRIRRRSRAAGQGRDELERVGLDELADLVDDDGEPARLGRRGHEVGDGDGIDRFGRRRGRQRPGQARGPAASRGAGQQPHERGGVAVAVRDDVERGSTRVVRGLVEQRRLAEPARRHGGPGSLRAAAARTARDAAAPDVSTTRESGCAGRSASATGMARR
jgi:hypothetical protein